MVMLRLTDKGAGNLDERGNGRPDVRLVGLDDDMVAVVVIASTYGRTGEEN